MKNRREFLFIYDVSDANPNGDPDDNKPRIDEETGINYVRDARLKRTIRDQIMEMNLGEGYEVFLREEVNDNGELLTRKDLFNMYNSYDEILRRCIDIRLFGGTFAIKKDKKKNKGEDNQEDANVESKEFIGPVQFKFGRSLHKVKVETVKGTSLLPSSEGKKQGTITETYIIPYSLITFYGIANEKAAKKTMLTDSDIDIMLKAMWIGHKASTDVITGSKFGHYPRVLIEIIYNEKIYSHIGELDKLVKIETNIEDKKIRDIEQVTLDFTKLKDKVQKNKHKIKKVRYIIDDRVKINPTIKEIFEGIEVVEFDWASEV